MNLRPVSQEPLTEEERRRVQVASFTGECQASNLLGWQSSKDARQKSASRYMSPTVCAACRFRSACCQRIDDADARARLRTQIATALGEDA